MFTTFVSSLIYEDILSRFTENFFKDIETFDLEDFKYNSVNITAFRLVDVETPKVVDIMEQMKKFQHSGKDTSNNNTSVIMVSYSETLKVSLIWRVLRC